MVIDLHKDVISRALLNTRGAIFADVRTASATGAIFDAPCGSEI